MSVRSTRFGVAPAAERTIIGRSGRGAAVAAKRRQCQVQAAASTQNRQARYGARQFAQGRPEQASSAAAAVDIEPIWGQRQREDTNKTMEKARKRKVTKTTGTRRTNAHLVNCYARCPKT